MEPVDLADIKRHLVLDPDDTSDDTYLTSMLIAARRACERRTNRTVVGEARLLTLRAFPSAGSIPLAFTAPIEAPIAGAAEIDLPGGTVTAATINYYAADGTDTVLDSAQYVFSADSVPAAVAPIGAWPVAQDRPDAVRIAYTVSPLSGDDLEMIGHAIRLIVGHWYGNREAVSSDARSAPIEMPLSVTWLLEPLRVWASS